MQQRDSQMLCIYLAVVTMDPAVLTGEDFHDKFDPTDYYEMYNQGFSSYCRGLPQFFLRHFHAAFSSLPSTGISVLDFGSGPSVLGAISAAPRAREIVLSDFTEKNRVEAKKWLQNEPSAFDWSAYFRYVIQDLEGKGGGELAIREREEMIRKTIKAVVPCNINKDPPLQGEYCREYDVVICSLVLECATQTREEYEAGMRRLGKLVAPGGLLLFVGVERSRDVGFYMVGERKFQSIGISSDFAVRAMEMAGLCGVQLESIPASNKDESVKNYISMKGTKL